MFSIRQARMVRNPRVSKVGVVFPSRPTDGSLVSTPGGAFLNIARHCQNLLTPYIHLPNIAKAVHSVCNCNKEVTVALEN